MSTAWTPKCCQALFPSRAEVGMEIGTGCKATVTVAILSVYNVVCVLAVDVFYVLFSFTRSSSNV